MRAQRFAKLKRVADSLTYLLWVPESADGYRERAASRPCRLAEWERPKRKKSLNLSRAYATTTITITGTNITTTTATSTGCCWWSSALREHFYVQNFSPSMELRSCWEVLTCKWVGRSSNRWSGILEEKLPSGTFHERPSLSLTYLIYLHFFASV